MPADPLGVGADLARRRILLGRDAKLFQQRHADVESTSQVAPGYRFQYQTPPKSDPVSTMRKLSTPAFRRLAADSRPDQPPPMITTSTSSVSEERLSGASA